MTVEELIKELEKFDKNKEVRLEQDEIENKEVILAVDKDTSGRPVIQFNPHNVF